VESYFGSGASGRVVAECGVGVDGAGGDVDVEKLLHDGQIGLQRQVGGVEAGFESGVVALYQKCPHLGCRVPNCVSSQWFECPCHGSQYNRVGEKRGGPAPRGMDRFAMSVTDGVLTVDTGTIVQGPPIGTNTTGQEAEGPHCIGDAGGH
jgi:Rieske Fe-S protein